MCPDWVQQDQGNIAFMLRIDRLQENKGGGVEVRKPRPENKIFYNQTDISEPQSD